MAGATFSTETQAQRMFPQKVQRGKITFVGAREVVLNDKTERLAPGAVVRTERNTIALTGSLRNQTFLVNYLRDPAGLVREVWILTPAEAERPVRRGQPMPSNAGDSPLYAN
ncbi:MAG: hypothetical protein Q4G70_04085 [Pseudomonadota bacterium]|nr:hypothetical protein [Pseudomonadota bacterium]